MIYAQDVQSRIVKYNSLIIFYMHMNCKTYSYDMIHIH